MTSNDLPAVSQGPTRNSARGRYLALRSLISKILLLLVVFIAVPVILYNEFRRADQDKQVLLSESLQEQGRLMAESLRPTGPPLVKRSMCRDQQGRVTKDGNCQQQTTDHQRGTESDRGKYETDDIRIAKRGLSGKRNPKTYA